jgi:hypothetical protein
MSVDLPKELAIPQGPGPWFAFMLVNVGQRPSVKKQTEIRCHSYPGLIQVLKNLNSAGDWQILLQVGPFWEWDLAIRFCVLWSNKTRGQMPRIARGIYLCYKYQDEGYKLLCAGQSKDELIETVKRRKEILKNNERKFEPPASLNPGQVDVAYVTQFLEESAKLSSGSSKKRKIAVNKA